MDSSLLSEVEVVMVFVSWSVEVAAVVADNTDPMMFKCRRGVVVKAGEDGNGTSAADTLVLQ